jgi:parallel beta-helix repeat protein
MLNKNVITFFLIASALALFMLRPRDIEAPINDSSLEDDVHSFDLTEEQRTLLETLKDNEASRIRAMGALTEKPLPYMPAKPKAMTPEELLSEQEQLWGVTHQRLVTVTNSAELLTALQNAQPGDFIYLQDGIYTGAFEATVSGRDSAPIVLYGTRNAILERTSIQADYGFWLKADYWILSGFTVRRASKGIMLDNANHNILNQLEVYFIGDEAIHFRTFSSHNILQNSWVHDTGLERPRFGEAVYIGTAYTNWSRYTDGKTDTSDHNQIINNLLGPDIAAETVDIKEGTIGSIVQNNTFITTNTFVLNAWVNVKGNQSLVSNNQGSYLVGSPFEQAVVVNQVLEGWGQNNIIFNNTTYAEYNTETRSPFRAIFETTGEVTVIIPERAMPYTLSEIVMRFPESFQRLADDSLLVKEHLLVGHKANLNITNQDASKIRLLSNAERFVSFVGFRSLVNIVGTPQNNVVLSSWDNTQNKTDSEWLDGRPYVFAYGGRMNLSYAGFTDLGFEEGIVSGVAWKGFNGTGELEISYGDVQYSSFVRNYFGAYTFEALDMHWNGNHFVDNLRYGFDPHDFSNNFLFENNTAHGNGSHGIIFSRGCDNNIIRNNLSYDNHGHGIMIDDGKVIQNSPNPRYQRPVASNYNIIENNRVWDNLDGIVLEGGENNVVRNNLINGVHRYGIRLKDKVTYTTISNNLIEGNAVYGVYIYFASDNNILDNNTIQLGRVGVTLQNSHGNIVTNNRIQDMAGSGIGLKGDVAFSKVENNIITGHGLHAINYTTGTNMSFENIELLNNIKHWRSPSPLNHFMSILAVIMWGLLITIPIVAKILVWLYDITQALRPTTANNDLRNANTNQTS